MAPQKSINLTALQTRQIESFKKSLLECGKRLNLFSRSGHELEFLLKESLITAQMLTLFFSTKEVLDLGSGNGFPGIVCGILHPHTPFILCERSRKRAEFLKHTLFQLKCSNITVACQPAEEIKTPFSLILSKATGPFSQILTLLEKLLDESGTAILWKSSSWKQSWPKSALFSAEVFKTYSLERKQRVLLQIKKKAKCSM